MAVKTFSVGEVLTASDTNTYLNNGGLVYVGQVTATSGTTVQVDNAFSSTYHSYRIVTSNMKCAAASGITLKLRNSGGASSTGYYYNSVYLNSYGGTTPTWGSVANDGSFATYAVADVTMAGFAFDVFNPNLAEFTMFTGIAVDPRTTGSPRFSFQGFHNQATAYTGFDMIFSQTIQSIAIRIYGYRQA